MKYGELNLGQVEAIVNKLGGMEGVQRLLADEVIVVEAKSSIRLTSKLANFPITVNYGQNLSDMILAGHYDWANSDITAEHFPLAGEGEQSVEVTLFHFNRSITSSGVIREMDQAGYRPAKIEELLALGAAQPDLQREFSIIGLGSVWVDRNRDRVVAYLGRRGSERELNLIWFGNEWDGLCRFAAVRK